jgi:hypothetical protein
MERILEFLRRGSSMRAPNSVQSWGEEHFIFIFTRCLMTCSQLQIHRLYSTVIWKEITWNSEDPLLKRTWVKDPRIVYMKQRILSDASMTSLVLLYTSRKINKQRKCHLLVIPNQKLIELRQDVAVPLIKFHWYVLDNQRKRKKKHTIM